MKLYKFKMFDNQNMEYVSVSGQDTWFTYPEVAKAYTQLLTLLTNNRYEVHQIYLTTLCVLE